MRGLRKLRSFWTKSLSRQLMLGIALVHAILMTIFVLDLVHRQQDFLIGQSREQAIGLAETLAASGGSWVLASDFIGMEEIISSQSGFPNLDYAIFIDMNNKVLGYTDRDKVGKYLNDEISLRLQGMSNQTSVLIDNAFFIDVVAPIIVNSQQIGWARVGINRDGIANNLAIVTRDGLFYTALAILVGIVFAWFMAQGLTSAIRHLAKGAREVGEGNRQINFCLDRSDELGMLSINLDSTVTILANKEKQLQRYQQHLEQTVQQRTAELQQANENLKKYSDEIEEDKSELERSYKRLRQLQEQLIESEKLSALGGLVAGVSHEINTPLGLTHTAISYIQDKLLELKSEFEQGRLVKRDFQEYIKDSIEMIGSATINTQRAIDLVKSFKEIAVAETTEVCHSFSIGDYLQSILTTFQKNFRQKSIIVDCQASESLYIYSEPGLFSQLFYNLINNSLRHGFEKKSQGNIEIVVRKKGQQLLIKYQDNGHGMSTEQLKKLYEPFYTTKMGQGGSGLGMHIVYNIINQRLKGSISCESEKGKGVSFEITLPVQFKETVS